MENNIGIGNWDALVLLDIVNQPIARLEINWDLILLKNKCILFNEELFTCLEDMGYTLTSVSLFENQNLEHVFRYTSEDEFFDIVLILYDGINLGANCNFRVIERESAKKTSALFQTNGKATLARLNEIMGRLIKSSTV